MKRPKTKWRVLERLLLAGGAVLLGLFLLARAHSYLMSRADLRRFQETQREPQAAIAASVQEADTPEEQNDSLWSKARIRGYEKSLLRKVAPPLGVLRIPKLNLEVAVLDGTDAVTLNRAVGHIAGTARPGAPGNVGIAGHRDGYFRGLKDIAAGDTLELETTDGTRKYIVEKVIITSPQDLSVLAPNGRDSLTLVTCYPFYYVGSAPKRYIIRASRQTG